MKNRALFVSTFGLLLLSSQLWAGRPEAFSKIDAPGAVVTVASGINNDGYIAGWYCIQTPCSVSTTNTSENNPRVRGFVRNLDGTFRLLNANDCTPGSGDCNHAVSTQPRQINPQGVVIGSYFVLERDANGKLKLGPPRQRGFAWCCAGIASDDPGTFVYFDPPVELYDNQDSPSTGTFYNHSVIPTGINAQGDIVGCIHDKDTMSSMHGFLLHDGAFSITNPGPATMNSGINPQGETVGLDFMNLTGYRLDKDGNVLERIYFPGSDETDAWDINGKGEIVGQAVTNNFTVGDAFLRSKQGDYSYIEPPGVFTASCLAANSNAGLPCTSNAFAIAGNGNVVGNYRDSFANCSVSACVHGFLLQRGDE